MRRIVFSVTWLILLTSWSARTAAMASWTWGTGPGVEIWQEDREEQREPWLPSKIYALDCPEVDQESFDRPVLFRCAVARQLPVTHVYLRYRASWKDTYAEIEMTKTAKGWYRARIPRGALNGMSVQFYFEGRDLHGEPVVTNGTAVNPNAVSIEHDPPRPPPWVKRPHVPRSPWEED